MYYCGGNSSWGDILKKVGNDLNRNKEGMESAKNLLGSAVYTVLGSSQLFIMRILSMESYNANF